MGPDLDRDRNDERAAWVARGCRPHRMVYLAMATHISAVLTGNWRTSSYLPTQKDCWAGWLSCHWMKAVLTNQLLKTSSLLPPAAQPSSAPW